MLSISSREEMPTINQTAAIKKQMTNNNEINHDDLHQQLIISHQLPIIQNNETRKQLNLSLRVPGYFLKTYHSTATPSTSVHLAQSTPNLAPNEQEQG